MIFVRSSGLKVLTSHILVISNLPFPFDCFEDALISCRRSVKMRFQLGEQMISPENDGGIQICYRSPAKKTTSWNERIPVLSIEVPNTVPLHKGLIDVRQNEKLARTRRTKPSYTATQAKSSAKCSVKHATNSSTPSKKCNTKRFHPRQFP